MKKRDGVMADIEKVIKGLEYCTSDGSTCDRCDYWEHNRVEDDPHCGDVLMRDALELLKQQNGLMLALEQSNASNEYLNNSVSELGETINILKDEIKRLKEQQAEIEQMKGEGKPPTWKNGKAFCGNCGGCLENRETFSAYHVSSIRFCKWCGAPVDWSNGQRTVSRNDRRTCKETFTTERKTV